VAEATAWLVLGSNIRPEDNLPRALDLLGEKVRVLAVSSVWQSPPADGSAQPDYWNAAVMIRTELSPEAVLATLIAPIERRLGRERTADRFAPRTIDIDLALYDDRAGTYSGKRLPHPDILSRAHAAAPLAEISPDKIHPETGEPLRAIAARLRTSAIRRREDIRLSGEKTPERPPGRRN
jgi:2-amino-4-hydroxy-6-hydroxymethyldihydropteridine diphosphokinase